MPQRGPVSRLPFLKRLIRVLLAGLLLPRPVTHRPGSRRGAQPDGGFAIPATSLGSMRAPGIPLYPSLLMAPGPRRPRLPEEHRPGTLPCPGFVAHGPAIRMRGLHLNASASKAIRSATGARRPTVPNERNAAAPHHGPCPPAQAPSPHTVWAQRTPTTAGPSRALARPHPLTLNDQHSGLNPRQHWPTPPQGGTQATQQTRRPLPMPRPKWMPLHHLGDHTGP